LYRLLLSVVPKLSREVKNFGAGVALPQTRVCLG
jgi:hypothetical protein